MAENDNNLDVRNETVKAVVAISIELLKRTLENDARNMADGKSPEDELSDAMTGMYLAGASDAVKSIMYAASHGAGAAFEEFRASCDRFGTLVVRRVAEICGCEPGDGGGE